MNQIDRIFETSKNAEQYADGYLKYLSEVLAKLTPNDHVAAALFGVIKLLDQRRHYVAEFNVKFIA